MSSIIALPPHGAAGETLYLTYGMGVMVLAVFFSGSDGRFSNIHRSRRLL